MQSDLTTALVICAAAFGAMLVFGSAAKAVLAPLAFAIGAN